LKYPKVADPPDVFLSDVEPVNEVVGAVRPHSYAIPKKARFNRSVNGAVLRNRDNGYFKGIGVQSPSELVFRLKPEYKRFVALAGVDDECIEWDSPGGMIRWPQWSQPFDGVTSFRISQVVFEDEGARVRERIVRLIQRRAFEFRRGSLSSSFAVALVQLWATPPA